MLNMPNYTPPSSPLFRVGLGSIKSLFVQGFDRERQEVPWFTRNGVQSNLVVIPRGPMLFSLDNTQGDTDAQLRVGGYDSAQAIGVAYYGVFGAVAPVVILTVPMGQKMTKVFTFEKDFLLVYISGPFATLPFTLQPLGLIPRSCATLPLAADGPTITGGGA